jgi:hypothetical protein
MALADRRRFLEAAALSIAGISVAAFRVAATQGDAEQAITSVAKAAAPAASFGCPRKHRKRSRPPSST